MDSKSMAVKFDTGKPRVDLIEPLFILGVAEVMTRGMVKYGKDNWKQGMEDVGRFYAAAQRHLLAYHSGQLFDPETGLSHLYHATCNLMMLDYYTGQGEVANHGQE